MGRITIFLFQWWQVDKVSPLKLFDENRSLCGFNLRRLMYQQNGEEFVKKTMDKVFNLFLAGKIKPLVDSTWALEDVSTYEYLIIDSSNCDTNLKWARVYPICQ